MLCKSVFVFVKKCRDVRQTNARTLDNGKNRGADAGRGCRRRAAERVSSTRKDARGLDK
jgi:hypothetical protein